MKQVESTILGQSYMLACPSGGEQLLQHAVAIVDREMSAIRDAGKVKARERIAVLTALNLAYQRAEHLRSAGTAKPTAPSAAAASPSTTNSATTNATGATATDADQMIEQLIARIDLALGDDGHLL